MLGAAAGGLIVFFSALSSSMNAVQQTSAFALALCLTVLPYCFARACSEIEEI